MEGGMPLTIISLSRNTLTRMNRQPEMNTAPSAASQEIFKPSTTV